MPQPKATESQRRIEAKRKADGELTPERPTKITAITKASDQQRRAQATNNKSKEGLFKANTAINFGRRSAGQGSGSRVQVRQERQHVDGATTTLAHPAQERSAIPMGRMSSLVVLPTPQSVITTGNDVDQDDVIVAILSQDIWDDKMTKMTVDNLAERARDCKSGGHLFDVAYLDRLLSRFDSAGITAERRSEVVGLLQTAFKRSLSAWSAFVDQAGNRDSQRVLPSVSFAGTRKETSSTTTHPSLGATGHGREPCASWCPSRRGKLNSLRS